MSDTDGLTREQFERVHACQDELLRVLKEAGAKPRVVNDPDRVRHWAIRLVGAIEAVTE